MRILTSGGESGDILIFSGAGTSGTTNITTNQRSGSRCYQITAFQQGIITFPVKSEYYFRIPIKVASIVSVANAIRWYAGNNQLGSVRNNITTGLLEIYTGAGTLVATGSIPLSPNIWYSIEIHVKIADSGGTIAVKIDGVPDVSFTGDTQPGSDATIDNLWCSAGNGNMYVDDVAINDTSNTDGLNDNSWCGDGHVVLLTPNGAGDVTELTPSTGSNYQCVDDIPPNDDTDYVSGTSGPLRDLYALSTYSLASNESVLRVVPVLRAREEAAAGDNVRTVVKTVSTEYESASMPVTTTYRRYEGTNYKTNPNTSAAWTQGQLDALQAGPKVV